MIEIQPFVSASKRILGKDSVQVAAAAEGTRGIFQESLIAAAGEVDDVMKQGSGLFRELGRREDAIRGFLSALDQPGQARSIEALPSELQLPVQGGAADPLVDLAARLEQSGHEFDFVTDSALEGSLLIDKSNTPEAIARLKAASSYWDGDLIPQQAANIDAHLRSEGPVNAEVAALLAQPIATAKIPTVAEKNRIGTNAIHLLPDQIVSSPQGFAAVEEAQETAMNFLSRSPGSTAIAVNDSRGAVHLLGVSGDTSARVITVKKALGRTSERSIEVRVDANHPSVVAAWRTDGKSLVRSHDKEWLRDIGSERLFEGSWPEGHLWPLTPDTMKTQGIAREHVSVRGALLGELERTQINRGRVASLNEELVARRSGIQSQRIELDKLGKVRSEPGNGTPYTWEAEPAYHTDNGAPLHFTFSPDLDGFSQPLHGYSMEDALLYTMNKEYGDPTKMIALMQDTEGTPHLVALAQDDVSGGSSQAFHADMRAVFNPALKKLWLADSTGTLSSVDTVQSEGTQRRLSANAGTVFAEILQEKKWGMASGGGNGGKFEWFGDQTPILYLADKDREQALDAASRIAKSLGKKRGTLFMVKVPIFAGGPEAYGLVGASQKGTRVIKGWNRDFAWQENAGTDIIAAIDDKGIAYQAAH